MENHIDDFLICLAYRTNMAAVPGNAVLLVVNCCVLYAAASCLLALECRGSDSAFHTPAAFKRIVPLCFVADFSNFFPGETAALVLTSMATVLAVYMLRTPLRTFCRVCVVATGAVAFFIALWPL
jgi:hypothetical protein